jgi:hypothetical protein
VSDGRQIVNRAREEAANYLETWVPNVCIIFKIPL